MKSGHPLACLQREEEAVCSLSWGLGQPKPWAQFSDAPCGSWITLCPSLACPSGKDWSSQRLRASWLGWYLAGGCGSAQGHPVARVDAGNAWTLPCLALLADSWWRGRQSSPGRRALLSLAPSLTRLSLRQQPRSCSRPGDSLLVLKRTGGAPAPRGRKGFCSRTSPSRGDGVQSGVWFPPPAVMAWPQLLAHTSLPAAPPTHLKGRPGSDLAEQVL